MLFNSFEFIFGFLPLTFFGAFLIGRYRASMASVWLAAASLVFYGMWDVRYVALLLISVVLNYIAGYWISLLRTQRPELTYARRVLKISIATNLIGLAYFKYFNFMLDTSNAVLGTGFQLEHIVLPLGISFFTFTQIAFLVDVYRGEVQEYRFTHYLLFVTYFPHLIAGPVLHHKQMMPQFSARDCFQINPTNVAVGLACFIYGLSQKILIADNLATYVNVVFSAAREGHMLTIFECWVGALAYTFQLYFDFSGYCDMAIGLSLMFNIRLPMNFDSPYKSRSIIEFWRRWHMTLSSFLRDYLYVPLGGNKRGMIRRYLNLLITMVLGGFWHGAGWTFLIWGAYHGVLLALNHLWCSVWRGTGSRIPKFVARRLGGILTFSCVVAGWVFFRADSIQSAWVILQGMAGSGNVIPEDWIPTREVLKLVIVCAMIAWFFPNTRQMLLEYKPTWNDMQAKVGIEETPDKFTKAMRWRPTVAYGVAMGLVFLWCVDGLDRVSPFLYFNF